MAIKKIENKKGLALVIRGRALWPKLTQPDTRFDADGVYSTKVILDDADVPMLNEILEDVRAQAVANAVAEAKEKGKVLKAEKVKLVDLPLGELEDKDTGEGTGEYSVSCKLKAVGKTREGKMYTRKVALFDAKGEPIKGDAPEIWNGSIINVNVMVSPYYVPALGAGAKLTLKGVQIIELVQGGERDADSYGFNAEDGYEYSADESAYPSSPEEAFGGSEQGDPAEADF